LSHRPAADVGRHRPTAEAGRHRPRGDGVPQPTLTAPRQRAGDGAPDELLMYLVPRQRPPGDTLPLPNVVRHGPGVPGVAAAGSVRAQSAAPAGHQAGPAPDRIRRRRRRGIALAVILLIAAGTAGWLRLGDHPPFGVTGVAITRQAKTGCGVGVTGRIDTNGSAGTVSYQWAFRPRGRVLRPVSQPVLAGQRAVYVTVTIEGQGHGTASQAVALDVLGPDPGTASTTVTITC
jgi:hypothetical protein